MKYGMSRINVIELPLYTPRRPSSRSTIAHTHPHIFTSSDVLPLRQRKRVLDLEADLGDLHRVRCDHLNASSARSRNHTADGGHVSLFISQKIAEQVVARQLQRLDREHADKIRAHAAIQSRSTLARQDSLERLDRILVQHVLSSDLSLFVMPSPHSDLHRRLHHVQRIHNRRCQHARRPAHKQLLEESHLTVKRKQLGKPLFSFLLEHSAVLSRSHSTHDVTLLFHESNSALPFEEES